METLEATVVVEKDKYLIRITDGEEFISIPISDDQPNEVKSAFNKIILRLKRGKFKINMVEGLQDLFSQVANEYIKQLNRELIEVFGEMEQYGLIECEENNIWEE